MTGQWSARSAMSSRKTLSPAGPMSYLHGLTLRSWTSFWRREDSTCMDMRNAPMVQSRQPLTYRLTESVGLGGPRWHGSSWLRGIAESGSSQLSILMIDIPRDLVWDLPCMQQASYLEGGATDVDACSKPATWKGAHWCGCCPCTCMLIKILMMMMMINMFGLKKKVQKTDEGPDKNGPICCFLSACVNANNRTYTQYLFDII